MVWVVLLRTPGSYLSLPSSLLARCQATSGFSCRESRQSHRSVLLVALLRPQRTSKGVGTHCGFNDQEALPVAKNGCDQQLLAPTAASEIKTFRRRGLDSEDGKIKTNEDV